MGQKDKEQLDAALDGNRAAVAAFIEQVTPVVQARVARALRATAAADKRDPREEVADLTQDVFVALFTEDAKVLRSWREDGGLSLRNFVGLVAERRVASILRSKRRSPYHERPTDDPPVTESPAPGPERSILKRNALQGVHDYLREHVSPLALDIFYRLFVHEQSVDEVCQATGLTATAVYAHRHRLKEAAQQAWADGERDLMQPPGPHVRPARQVSPRSSGAVDGESPGTPVRRSRRRP